MKTFSIRTDSGAQTIEAKSVNDAIAKYMGTASGVRSLAAFKKYLEKHGGFGVVEEDGVVLLRVR